MVHAFVFAKTGTGDSPGVLESIRSIDGITDGHVVAGDYDIIFEVDAADVNEILSLVSGEVQLLDGVLDTKTYIALD